MGEHMQMLGQSPARLDDELSFVASKLSDSAVLAEQSLARMLELIERFGQFVARGFDVNALEDVTAEHVGAFVRARGRDLPEPSVATMHLRRTGVRLLFRTARGLGLVTGDPTLDLRLDPRSGVVGRPLTDDEVGVCRTAALQSLTSTRLSAAWALAEATARTAELPCLSVADLDLETGRVWIHGSPRTEPRQAALTEWGQLQLARHLRGLGRELDPAMLLIYAGSGSAQSRQASSCQSIGETLRRAGLGDEPDVRPISVAAWAGSRVFAQSGRIEVAARALGVRSLDRAARLIGHDWREPADSDA